MASPAEPYFDPSPVVTATADAAVTAQRIAKVADGRVGGHVAIAHATAGTDVPEGVVIRDAAEGADVELALEGVWPITAGETIAAGDPIAAGTGGKAFVAAAEEYAIGVAWDDAAADAAVPVRLGRFTVPAA